MFEQVVATVLNRLLGSYVEGLETSQLNIGIWAGDVHLKNLRLRSDALDALGLPVRVRSGSLGALRLAIPWTALKSQPIRVSIDGVDLVAVPRAPDEVARDPREEVEGRIRRKLEQIKDAESVRMVGISQAASAAGQGVWMEPLVCGSGRVPIP